MNRTALHRTASGPSDPAAEAGFTLVETLTAMAILAIALTSLLASFGDGVRAARATGRVADARALAETLIASASSAVLVRPGTETGITDGLRWRVVTTTAADGADPAPRFTLARITVDVTWDGSRRAERLETLRLIRGTP